MDPLRILMVITVSCSRNGITAAAMNEIAAVDPSQMTVDLLVQNEPEESIARLVEGKGGKIYILPSRYRHTISYACRLSSLLKRNRYYGIHVHGNSSTMAMELFLARRNGIPVRVSHAHNTRTRFPFLHRMLLPLMLSNATRYAACGKDAGRWLYGERPFTIIPNAIDGDRFQYDEKARIECRKELGISDHASVYLHVGTFNAQKNHPFLLRAFFQIAENDPNAVLILLGSGKMMPAVQEKAESSKYRDRILFCGSVKDASSYYSAADCFLLPSLHEGLPFTAIEAQCNGLSCLVSDSVSKDTDMTGLVQFLSLDDEIEKWADRAQSMAVPCCREEASKNAIIRLNEEGYILGSQKSPFMDFYLCHEPSIKKLMIVTHKMTGGGCERVISILADRFVSSGMEVLLVPECNVKSVYPLPDKLRIEFLLETDTMRAKDVPRAYSKLYRITKRERPDMVLAMPEKVNVWTILFLMPLKKVPVVVSERNDPYHHPESRIKRLLRKLVYPFASGFIFQTEDARKYFSERIREKGIILENPVDLSSLPAPYRGNRKKAVVSVGRLNEQKNYELLIDAFSEFIRQNPEWILEIYGEGTERERLEQRIIEQGLEGKAFLRGYVSSPSEFIKDAGIFVLPSNYEGMPNALIEAMSMELPCIATDCPIGGPKALIEDKKNGILIPPGRKDLLAKAMKELAEDGEMAERIGRAAGKLRERLDADLVADQWRKYLENVKEQ